MRGEGASLARLCKQWVVILKAPAAGGNPAHMYCAVVFLDHVSAMARVGIISSLVGEDENISTHCRGVVGRWLRESGPDFMDNAEYFYYPVKKCLRTGKGLYSIGATMIHAMAVMRTGRVYYGEPVNKPKSRQIRESAKHAFICRRSPRVACGEVKEEHEEGDEGYTMDVESAIEMKGAMDDEEDGREEDGEDVEEDVDSMDIDIDVKEEEGGHL